MAEARGQRLRIPRPVAVVLAPAIALMMAGTYYRHQSAEATAAVEALCAQFAAGGRPLRDFAFEAQAGGLVLQDSGAGSQQMIAAREVFGLRKESYRCTATHDGQVVTATRVSRISVE